MSVWANLLAALGWTRAEGAATAEAKARRAAQEPAWLAATAAVDAWRDDPDDMERQTQLYRRLAWVQMAISTVARACAGVRLNVQQQIVGQGERLREIDNHPFELLLQRPNPRMSRFELVEGTVAYRMLTGNAYWWLNRAGEKAPPSEIWLLPAQRVRPLSDGRMGVRGYAYDPGDGKTVPLELWEVVHFRSFHPDNVLQGLSPLEALRLTTQGDLAMQRWNAAFFGENNAKVPGALAFADPIDDATWEALKEQIRAEHGGMRRQMMLMRGVGAGGVQWVNMALSQRDMEFLAARTFNKEEIFALYAPGLASVLSVNATEANATVGKATLLEFGIWPQLVMMAEKITNDLLPAYGENLVASFDDVRGADRAMLLQEQAAFAQVHTVDEVRAKYYQDGPLGDERGNLLPREVGSGRDVLVGDRRGPGVAGSEAAKMTRGEEVITLRPKGAVRRWAVLPPRRLTAGAVTRSVKALTLQLDPDDDEAEARIREALERRFGRELAAVLRGQLDALLPEGATDVEIRAAVERLAMAAGPLQEVLARNLARAADLGVTTARDTLARAGIQVDWALAHLDAAAWARRYAFELVTGITETTAARLQDAVARYFDEGLALDDLRAELVPLFGAQRARLIAQTETTRAAAEGTRIGFTQSGVVGEIEIRTAMDELVCPICGPLYGTRHALESGVPGRGLPPFHPGCRCWIVAVVGEDAPGDRAHARVGRSLAAALRGRAYVARHLAVMDVNALARQVLAADDLPAVGYHFARHGQGMGVASETEYLALFREVMARARQQADTLYVTWRKETQPDLMWRIFDRDTQWVVQYNQTTGSVFSFYRAEDWDAFVVATRPVQVRRSGEVWRVEP